MKWMIGVTTVPSRRTTLLPKTLVSMREVGFGQPHLFVDDEPDPGSYLWKSFGLDVTGHHPKLGTVGNWVTALWTLWVMDPHADRYALFQDDVVFCKGLREYLDAAPWVEKTYLNLYSSEYNEVLVAKAKPGTWMESYVLNSGGRVQPELAVGPATERWQCGKGALAIVFDGGGVMQMLGSKWVAGKPRDKDYPRSKLDGMIVNAMNQAGWKELIHAPSLCQHVGQESSMGNDPRPCAASFPGENFDARDYLTGK